MKIYVTNYITFIQKFGGISRFSNNLSLEYEKITDGYTICSENFKFLRKLDKLQLPNFLKVMLIIVIRYTRIYTSNFSLIHDTYPTKLSRLVPWSRTLITIYDCMPEIYPSLYSKQVRDERKFYIKKANHIHAISYSTKNDIVKFFGIYPDKITVIYLNNMINKTASRNSFGFNQRNFILYVGNRQGYKNFDGALLGYSLIYRLDKSLKLVLFGGGTLNQSERNKIAKLNIPNEQVIQLDGDDTLLSRYYAKSRLLLYTSHYEGFGLPVLEAIDAGCPVLVSDRSSLKEVMPAKKYRIVSYTEVELRTKIQYFISENSWNEVILEQICATKHFKNYPTSDKLLELYAKIKNQ